jgi:hypothetical protein
MFKAVHDHSTSEDVSWQNCVGICPYEASALIGHTKVFEAEGTLLLMYTALLVDRL